MPNKLLPNKIKTWWQQRFNNKQDTLDWRSLSPDHPPLPFLSPETLPSTIINSSILQMESSPIQHHSSIMIATNSSHKVSYPPSLIIILCFLLNCCHCIFTWARAFSAHIAHVIHWPEKTNREFILIRYLLLNIGKKGPTDHNALISNLGRKWNYGDRGILFQRQPKYNHYSEITRNIEYLLNPFISSSYFTLHFRLCRWWRQV